MEFGIGKLLLMAVIVVLVFGIGKLPRIGEDLGKALRSFKKAAQESGTAPSDTTH